MRTTVTSEKFGSRSFNGGNKVELYDANRNTYAVFYGMPFCRVLNLHDENGEPLTVETVLNYDKDAVYAFHCLCNSLNNDNVIVIKNQSGYWKPAKSSRELQDLAHIKSNTAWARARDALKDSGLLAKSKTSIRGKTSICYLISPLFFIKTTERRLPVRLINEFAPEIKRFIKDPRTRRELDQLLSIGNDPAGVDKKQSKSATDKVIEGQTIEDILLADDEVASPAPTTVDTNFTQEEAMDIWHTLILGGELPCYYALTPGAGMKKVEYTDETDLYYTPNRMTGQENSNKNPKDADINEFHAVFLDFDAGRDEQHNYYPDEIVQQHKKYFLQIMDALPLPTIALETRNGIQLTYAVTDLDTKEAFDQLETKLISLVKVADEKVKNAARLMRVPGSVWHKPNSGLPAFQTSIVRCNNIAYSQRELEEQLDYQSTAVDSIAEGYIELFGLSESSKKPAPRPSSPKPLHNGDSRFAYRHTDRLEAISKLSTDTFEVPATATTISDEDKYSYCCQLNLFEFLGISETTGDFNDLFHDDSNPSAHIFDNHDKGYRYICLSTSTPVDDRGWNIIDCVSHLSGCSKQEALKYIMETYNIKTA